MFLTPLMISTLCSSAYPNHQDACGKFLEASERSTPVYAYDDKIENYYTAEANNIVKDNLGTVGSDAVGGVGYTYKVYKNKAVEFKLPNLGLCDSASNRINTNSYTLNLSWKFPWLK